MGFIKTYSIVSFKIKKKNIIESHSPIGVTSRIKNVKLYNFSSIWRHDYIWFLLFKCYNLNKSYMGTKLATYLIIIIN